MSRRCLICANINPCREHSEEDQAAELARNDAAIAAIKRGETPTTTLICVAWKAYGEWKITVRGFANDREAQKHIDNVLCTPDKDYNKNAQIVRVEVKGE